MFFESVSLQDRKPARKTYTGNHTVLVNPKTGNMISVKVGMAMEWEYFISKGFTHWIKPISRENLLKKLNK